MDINNIRASVGHLNNFVMNNLEDKNTDSIKNNSEQSLKSRDTIDISKSARNFLEPNGIGFSLDKGTAANTTVYVNRGTFNQMVNYTTNNPECQWSELGVDCEKRWVVVNGQRFECPLSKEEKEAIRRRLEESDLISIITKADKENAKHKNKLEKYNSVRITLDGKNGIIVEGMEKSQSNEKLTNLMKNEKVMKMLSDIIGKSGGINLGLG